MSAALNTSGMVPSGALIEQQLSEADLQSVLVTGATIMNFLVPWNTAPTYLVHDNDGATGQVFTSRVWAMGIRDRPISPRSPWQNPYVERLIGTLRRDCLNHVLIIGRAESAANAGFIF